MKSYILLTYEGNANHAMINRNDFQTGLIDKQLLAEEPKIEIAKAQFENVKLRSKILTLEQDLIKRDKFINRLKYKARVSETYHWQKDCKCEGSPYEELTFTTDNNVVNCTPCRLRADKEIAEQAVRLSHTPLI